MLEVPEGDDRWRHVCQSCGQVHFFNPKLVVGCLVESQGRVLLCKRAIEPCKGRWTLPAGYLELGESTAGSLVPCSAIGTALFIHRQRLYPSIDTALFIHRHGSIHP
jgi:8-oxo-dGTP pyrophosphatase MutT (NUDIX family)